MSYTKATLETYKKECDKMSEAKLSNCCGSEDGATSIDGPSWSDVGICPDCREHCEFIEAEEE